jgi:chromosome segregation ATPase
MDEIIFYFTPRIATQPANHSDHARSRSVSGEPDTVPYVDQRKEIETLKAQNKKMMADQELLARQVEDLKLQMQDIDNELSVRHAEIGKLKSNANASDQVIQQKLQEEKQLKEESREMREKIRRFDTTVAEDLQQRTLLKVKLTILESEKKRHEEEYKTVNSQNKTTRDQLQTKIADKKKLVAAHNRVQK